ncbi:MAG: DUF1592 domain-containing protein [Planctomycetota bacterium]
MSRTSLSFAFRAVLLIALALPTPVSSAADGEQIYRERCASCHGVDGLGVKGKYDRPLYGSKNLRRLERYIVRSMPEEKPELCVGEDATKVARYVFDEFYSPEAQARRQKVRVEVSRLTVRQYRNACADLLAEFLGDVRWNDDRGLTGEYFNSRTPGRSRAIRRVDPVLRFDFAKQNPSVEKLGKAGFAARWSGSVFVPETGSYEFLLRSDHAIRMWLNGPSTFIDAFVKSGDDSEFRGSMFLLGGRAYPVTIEFSSRRQGVNKKEKAKTINAFVELAWRRPGSQIAETISERFLLPKQVPVSYVATTPFPPDDRSAGYERGSAVSKAWSDAVTRGAIETSNYVKKNLRRLTGGGRRSRVGLAAAKSFARKFVERAFRRPLKGREGLLYIDRHFEGVGTGSDVETVARIEKAVGRVVLLAMTSPRFLYVDFARDEYDAASRLAFSLWDSLPDRALLDAVAAGQLKTQDGVAKQVERMLDDPRTHSKFSQFLRRWLHLEGEGLQKDAKVFPEFDEKLIADLATSLDLFLEDFFWSEASDADFRKLFRSRDVFLSDRLAKFYGVTGAGGDGFRRAKFSEKEDRAGLLTHPLLLSKLAYEDGTSPIHRGVFLIRNVLGRGLRPPPDAFTPLAADLHPKLSTRERVELQTKGKSCQSCHRPINGLGFTLEGFDAVGRVRPLEKGRPVDTSGSVVLPDGKLRPLAGAQQMAEFLASSSEVHTGFAVQLFHHFVKQPILAYGADTPERLRRAFEADTFNVRKLIANIVSLGVWNRPKPVIRNVRVF